MGSNEIENEATEFTAQAHLDQVISIFRIFNLDARRWVKCSILDNWNVNLAVGELLSVPHVVCANHRLNLEVSKMIRYDVRQSTVLGTGRETIVSCNNGLRTSAMLRNINNLHVLVDNNTRWSGKFTILKRFNIIHSGLIEVADRNGVILKFDRSSKFKKKCHTY